MSYVSGHGFGHAVASARSCAHACGRPDLEPVIRSPLGRWFFEFNLGAAVAHGHCRLDVGVVQADTLTTDLDATLHAYAAIDADAGRLVDAELDAVAAQRPALVFADIPALAFDVAARLGVPGVAMTNFSWDWIYADYAGGAAGVRAAGRQLARVVRSRDAVAAPAAARRPRRVPAPRATFRSSLDAPTVSRGRRARLVSACRATGRLVLLSFGGIGLALDRTPALRGVTFVSTGGAVSGGSGPDGCRSLTARRVDRHRRAL